MNKPKIILEKKKENRYEKTFFKLKNKNEKALISFVVIGDPDYNTSLEIVKKLVDSGADILELGFPFSDPIADGKVIQAADVRSLNNGMNTDLALKFISDVRKFTDIPIGLLIYSNLIYQRGIEKFYLDSKSAGVDSILLADVPIEEALPYILASKKVDIDSVFIISPLTDDTRAKKILNETKGFVYIVSRLGVTGVRSDLEDGTLNLLRRVRPYTKLPLCVGFGISEASHVKSVISAGADGVIIGSAIVKIIEDNLNDKNKMLNNISNYVKEIKNATR